MAIFLVPAFALWMTPARSFGKSRSRNPRTKASALGDLHRRRQGSPPLRPDLKRVHIRTSKWGGGRRTGFDRGG